MKITLYKVIRPGCDVGEVNELSSFSLASSTSGFTWTAPDEDAGFTLSMESVVYDVNNQTTGTCNSIDGLLEYDAEKLIKLTFKGDGVQCTGGGTNDITIKFVIHSSYHTGNIGAAIGDCMIGFPTSGDFWKSVDATSIYNTAYPGSTLVFESNLLLNVAMGFSQTFDVDNGGNCVELDIDANDDDIDNGNIEVEFTLPGVGEGNSFTYDPDLLVQEGQLMGGFPILAAILILTVLICCCFGCCAYYCCCRKKKGGRKGAVAPKPTNLS